jgi:hypothetical protein
MTTHLAFVTAAITALFLATTSVVELVQPDYLPPHMGQEGPR